MSVVVDITTESIYFGTLLDSSLFSLIVDLEFINIVNILINKRRNKMEIFFQLSVYRKIFKYTTLLC